MPHLPGCSERISSGNNHKHLAECVAHSRCSKVWCFPPLLFSKRMGRNANCHHPSFQHKFLKTTPSPCPLRALCHRLPLARDLLPALSLTGCVTLDKFTHPLNSVFPSVTQGRDEHLLPSLISLSFSSPGGSPSWSTP